MLRDHYLPWCSCYWDHASTLSSGLLLSAFLALAFPCPPVIFARGMYDYARQPLVCSHFACGVMSELPAVYSRIFILSCAYLLSHGVPNPYSTHDILCALPHNVFFFTSVTLYMVFSLPGSHYPSHFSTGHFYISSKKEDRHHSSRNLPWHSLFSSLQVRLDASILCSQKHSQLTQG